MMRFNTFSKVFNFSTAVPFVLFRNIELFSSDTVKAAGTNKTDSQDGLMSDSQLQVIDENK